MPEGIVRGPSNRGTRRAEQSIGRRDSEVKDFHHPNDDQYL